MAPKRSKKAAGESSESGSSRTASTASNRAKMVASRTNRLADIAETTTRDDHGHTSGGGEDRGEEYGEGTEEQETELVQERGGEDKVEDDPNAPFPGGPEDRSVLLSFKHHVACAIWRGELRGPLRCINHGKKIVSWDLYCNPNAAEFHEIIERSGLSPLMSCSYDCVHRSLLSSFTERWHPEMNTFHLPFGTMTITLDDVRVLLRILVTGKAVMVEPLGFSESVQLLQDALGVTTAEVTEEMTAARGCTVSLKWLRNKFGSAEHTGRRFPGARETARAYLLYLLGSTLFTDKTGARVSVALLHLLMDVDAIGSYAWGTTALAYLYYQLGCASRASVSQIVGYLTLLEGWIYDHFPFTKPNKNAKYYRTEPRVNRWKPKMEIGQNENNIMEYMTTLDALTPEEVLWDPYEVVRDPEESVHELAFYSGLICYMDYVEPYHPDWILRQLGYVQTIPTSPLRPGKAERISGARYTVKHHFVEELWEAWGNHVLSSANRGQRVRLPHDAVPHYRSWFEKISHPILINPESGSGGLHEPIRDDASNRIRNVLSVGKQYMETPYNDMTMNGLVTCVQRMCNILSGVNLSQSRSSDHVQAEASKRRGLTT